MTVGIAYRYLPHYRVTFFSALHRALEDDGIGLQLCYGTDRSRESVPSLDPVWAHPVHNATFGIGTGSPLVWQPVPSIVRNADLIVLMQENRLVSNFPILLNGMLGGSRVALWGHGQNLEQSFGSPLNRFKRFYSRRVHWWFAYTNSVADAVARSGFPRDRITIVENAIDTAALRRAATQVDDAAIDVLRRRYGIVGGPVAVFCGRLYERKRIQFLLEAGLRIRKRLAHFELIIIGAGPDAAKVTRFTSENDWVHHVGAFYDEDIVPFFRLADACLMPGVIGLTILDAFALETPLVTTRLPDHGPEIEYLRNGVNGIMTENSIDAFVEAALHVLTSSELRQHLRLGCRTSADQYTLRNMVSNFRSGVNGALEVEL